MWFDYSEQNDTPYLIRLKIQEKISVMDSDNIKVIDNNITTLKVTKSTINFKGEEPKIDLLRAVQTLSEQGLHHITVQINDIEDDLWYYRPGSALLQKYFVYISIKNETKITKMKIKSEIKIPSGRLYYMIGNQPFRFSFPDMEQGIDYYFLIKKPEQQPSFNIDTLDLPDRSLIHSKKQCSDFGLGIELKIT